MINGKKKGSTFVIVVVLMSIIFTLGSAILTVTLSDYKIRINESKKLQNLYLADSGLDIVENIITKSTQQIIKYADVMVRKEILSDSNIYSNYEKLEDLDIDSDYINNRFKEIFIDIINKNEGGIPLFKYLITNKKYIENIKDNGDIIYSDYDYKNEDKEFEIKISEDNDGYTKIKKEETEGIEIKVLSTFQDTKGDLKNSKTISTKFQILAPEYNAKLALIDILNIYDKKAITIDGNLELKEGGSLNVEGDIWVKGNEAEFNESKFIFEKYKGGIDLDNSNFTINGNIYTNETLSLRNNVISTINGNLYARNMYIGKEAGTVNSSNNKIIVMEDVIVNNDLALNSTNSSININKNFYAINDKTTKEEADTSQKALNSSSIIVNEVGSSNIKIDGTSYIMGVAYLNATDLEGNKYQTGESVAIKGNYLAYSDVGDINEKIKLKYYSPLQLLEGIGDDNSLDMKSNYIYNYYSSGDKSYTFNDGGVYLNNVKSVGTSIDINGRIKKAQINVEDINLINKIRDEFAINVFAMGDSTNTEEDLYEKQEVVKTVGEEKTAQINKEEIEKLNIENDGEKCLIVKKGDTTLTGNKEGLVIVDGNIIIDGDFNFNGAIIATGNVTFKGYGNRNIKYDANVIKDILAENTNLKNIFKSNNSTSSEIRVSSNSTIYNKESFLNTSSWKIEK